LKIKYSPHEPHKKREQSQNVGGENLKGNRLKMLLTQFFDFLGYKKRDLTNSLPKLLAVILTANTIGSSATI
jgi:hypothetical protein